MRTILPEQKNPILRRKAGRVPLSEIKGRHLQNLIKEMKALLAKEEFGVALAAPQVGEPIRLFIVSGKALARGMRNAPDLPAPAGAQRAGGQAGKSERKPSESKPSEVRPHWVPSDQVYINPELLKISRTRKEKHEGCLSVRGLWGIVRRAEKATIRAYDENGGRFTRGASGFLAHIFQHEMDHLEGILYTDKAMKLYKENEDGKQ